MALAPSNIHELFLKSHGESRAAGVVSMERAYILETLSRYWPRNPELILALTPTPPEFGSAKLHLPPKLTYIQLPDWAADCGVDGKLLAPADFLHDGVSWKKAPWLEVAFWHLSAIPEQAHELHHGVACSDSRRLKGWDPALWDRAWVNRIALFLRRWAARNANGDEAALFGQLPRHEIVLVQEILAPTAANSDGLFSRLKRWFKGNRFRAAWSLRQALAAERASGVRSVLLVRRPPNGESRQLLKGAATEGWPIGLYLNGAADELPRSKDALEGAIGTEATACRTDEFSWQETWRNHSEAGFARDYSLGFQDRAGFRSGAALAYKPWLFRQRRSASIDVIPNMVLNIQSESGRDHVQRVINEITSVHGIAAISCRSVLDEAAPDGIERYRKLLATVGIR